MEWSGMTGVFDGWRRGAREGKWWGRLGWAWWAMGWLVDSTHPLND